MNITSSFEIIYRDGDVPSDIISWINFVYQIPLVLIGFKTKSPKAVVFFRQSEKRSVSLQQEHNKQGCFFMAKLEGVSLTDGFNGVC